MYCYIISFFYMVNKNMINNFVNALYECKALHKDAIIESNI